MSQGAGACDVIVIGLGAMGSSAAYHLAARGQRVLGLDRFTPPHAMGSSHGGSRITRQSYFEDAAYVPLLLRAHELWDRLAADSGRDLIRLCGGMYLGGPDSETFGGALRAAREWSLPHEVLDAAEVRRRFPAFTPGPDVVALYEERAGFTRPEETVAANLDLAAAAGADLRFRTPALGWTAAGTGDGVTVRTAEGTYAASRLVICPGAWAPALLADLGVPMRVERQVMFWFEADTSAFAENPIFVWEAEDGVQFYGFPAMDGPGGGVKIGLHNAGGVESDPDAIDRIVHPREVEVMRSYVAPRLPGLAGPLLRAATCMYTNTPDRHFVVAAHPGYPQVSVACGFSGHGFKFTPVIGEILADLATDGSTAHPIALFDPLRPAARPSGR
jgi:sarcosine oxidase